MAIDNLATWKSEFANLPKVSDTSWKQNLADYIAARVDGKLTLSSYVLGSGGSITFTFNKTTFINALSGVTSGLGNGVTAIASGVKNAVQVSGSLQITPLVSIGTPSPTNTFSSITSAAITSASADLARAKIEELNGAAAVSDANDSAFPVKLRDAFLLLAANITGLDSQTPTPQTKTDNGRAVQ